MQNSQVSFKSNIRFINQKEFLKKTVNLSEKVFIDDPWTANEIIRASKGYTVMVRTCTAGGIITRNNKNNGFNAVMFHLCPPKEYTPENKDFGKIEKTIFEKLSKDKFIQGFLIGSKKMEKYSIKWFDKIESFFKKLHIPYSKCKNQPDYCSTNLMYNGIKDEWFISQIDSHALSPISKPKFEEIFICDKDKLTLDM